MLKDSMHNAATDGRCTDWACVTLASKTTSVQHTCEDHDEDTMHLEDQENLAKMVEGRSIVFVQEDFDDINFASSASLSPDLGGGVALC